MNGREKCKAALTRRLQQERQSQLQLNRNRKNGRISNYELDNINRDNKSIKSEILSLESALAKVDRGIALAPDQQALLEEHMLTQADKFIQGRFLGAKERARLTAMKELEDKKAPRRTQLIGPHGTTTAVTAPRRRVQLRLRVAEAQRRHSPVRGGDGCPRPG